MLSNKTLKRASAFSLIASTAVLASTVISPAFAATAATYGAWSDATMNTEYLDYSGTIDFSGSGIPNANYVTVFDADDSYNDVAPDINDSEWLTSETPFGAAFGASGPSDTTNFLRIDGGLDVHNTTTITFDSPVPAGRLGIAIGDLDYDTVEIGAQDSNGDFLTSEQLIGASTENTFNLCNVTAEVPTTCDGGETTLPVMSTESDTVIFEPNADPDGDGESGWISPSAEISTLIITQLSSESSIRIWLAGINDEVAPVQPELANTGASDPSIGLWSALALGGFGITGLAFAARRKTSN